MNIKPVERELFPAEGSSSSTVEKENPFIDDYTINFLNEQIIKLNSSPRDEYQKFKENSGDEAASNLMERGSQHYKELRDKLDPDSTTVIKADSELGKKYGFYDQNKFNQIPEEIIQKDIQRHKNNPDTPYSLEDYKEYRKLLNPQWDDETNLVASMPKYKYKLVPKEP
jgi:hypothetical protein